MWWFFCLYIKRLRRGGFTAESVTQSSKTAGGLFFSSTVSQDLVPALPGWSIMFRDK